MRLLDTTTMRLIEIEGDIPPYAILSHVWEKEEVEFKDIMDPSYQAQRMYGYKKILFACKTAKQDGLKYIWIDTCCIDKQSSTELSEAINSMYLWYKNARVCYAYLSDVPRKGNHNDPGSLFANSRWFTRGWTLQELIAPATVIFYAVDWVHIGTKVSLQETISITTGIRTEVIVGDMGLDKVSIAARMSWAANRHTTRVEDRTYSLMGLFGINMSPLYGEGERAFIRLQHEIIKKSTDHSIFAWTAPGAIDKYRGILARSPEEFYNSREVEMGGRTIRKSYFMTNQGLQIELPVKEIVEDGKHITLAALDCHLSGKSEAIVITLMRTDFLQSSEYVRSETSSTRRTIDRLDLAPRSLLYIVDDYSSDQGRNQETRIHAQPETKASRGYVNTTSTRFGPAPALGRPDMCLGCFVTPPADRHGFTIETRIYRKGTSNAEWIQHEGSFVFYREHGSRAIGVMVLTNDDPSTKQLFLFIEPEESFVWSAIWANPWHIEQVLSTNKPHIKRNPYDMAVGQGKKVYVNVSHNRKTTMADHTILLSIRQMNS